MIRSGESFRHFQDFGHDPVLCDFRNACITSGMLSGSASEFRSEKAFRVTPAVTKVDSLLRATSLIFHVTRLFVKFAPFNWSQLAILTQDFAKNLSELSWGIKGYVVRKDGEQRSAVLQQCFIEQLLTDRAEIVRIIFQKIFNVFGHSL